MADSGNMKVIVYFRNGSRVSCKITREMADHLWDYCQSKEPTSVIFAGKRGDRSVRVVLNWTEINCVEII